MDMFTDETTQYTSNSDAGIQRPDGPCYEAPQPPAHVPDPGRLKPDPSNWGQEVHERRQRANQDSGIIDWLTTHGVPVFDACVKKSGSDSAETSRTASNADQEQLIASLEWAFYGSLTMHGVTGSIYGLQNVFNVVWMYMQRAQAPKTAPLKIPTDWTESHDNKSTCITLRCLGIHLHTLNKEATKASYMPSSVLCPRKDIEALKYPEPNVTLNESRMFIGDPALCVEWSMFKVLGFPGLSKCRSEMDVERHVGSILAGFFNVHGCVTSSGTQIKYPTAVGCFGSFPKPDFGTRISGSSSIPELFRPLVLVGGAKRDVSDKDKPMDAKKASNNRISAQLAWAIQPTLISIIADAMLKWEESRRKGTTRGLFVLPSHAVVYGIAYDAFGFIIYGFFPRVLRVRELDGTPDQWGFGCAPVDTQFNTVFVGHDRRQRLHACVCLLLIQGHAAVLSKALRGLELPTVFKTCAKLWAQRKL